MRLLVGALLVAGFTSNLCANDVDWQLSSRRVANYEPVIRTAYAKSYEDSALVTHVMRGGQESYDDISYDIEMTSHASMSHWQDSDNSSDGEADGGGDASSQANNPLANMTAFNIQNYYIGNFSEVDGSGNQFVLRYAKPISIGESQWLMRASLPMNTLPFAPTGSRKTALGDLNIFAAYLADTGNPAVSFGVGPQITLPTASNDMLGSNKMSLGVANVMFDGRSKVFQYGYLLTWQGSVAGPETRPDVNVAAFQPFAFAQLGEGWYLRTAPIWVFTPNNDGYGMPVGIGLGKVIKSGNTVFNFFVEPQWSAADRGPYQPEFQIYTALNMQFVGGN